MVALSCTTSQMVTFNAYEREFENQNHFPLGISSVSFTTPYNLSPTPCSSYIGKSLASPITSGHSSSPSSL